jgi:hypothetical protein
LSVAVNHEIKLGGRSWTRDTLYQQTLSLSSSISGGRSVGTVRSRTKATEILYSNILYALMSSICATCPVHCNLPDFTVLMMQDVL